MRQHGGFSYTIDTTSLSGRLVKMYPSQDFWLSKIVGLMDSLVDDYECNGVYIDQVSAMSGNILTNRYDI